MHSVLGTGVFNSDGEQLFTFILPCLIRTARGALEVGRLLTLQASVSENISFSCAYRFHRTMARPFFSNERVRHFENFDRHASTAHTRPYCPDTDQRTVTYTGKSISKIKSRFKEGFAIDFQV